MTDPTDNRWTDDDNGDAALDGPSTTCDTCKGDGIKRGPRGGPSLEQGTPLEDPCPNCGGSGGRPMTDHTNSQQVDGAPIDCPTCGEAVGPVWPNPNDGRLPVVVHLDDGRHEFRWPSTGGVSTS